MAYGNYFDQSDADDLRWERRHKNSHRDHDCSDGMCGGCFRCIGYQALDCGEDEDEPESEDENDVR